MSVFPTPMNPSSITIADQHILYDADTISTPATDLFNYHYHRDRGALLGQSQGRGTTWFFTLHDRHYVLRHYLRGGKLAPLLRDRYLWFGLTRSRAFQEWRLLAQCTELGLPVPRPLAARVVRQGFIYRADIITHRILDARPLAQALTHASEAANQWRTIGHCIRRFHDAQIYHADLNAHNILITSTGEVYLIDFDKGRIGYQGHGWKRKNLSRLQRSLTKISQLLPSFNFTGSDFEHLNAGYQGRF